MKTSIKLLFIGFLSVTVLSCEKMFIGTPGNDPEAIFEELWSTFNEEYAPFEERNVDWERVYEEFRPLVSQNSTSDELFSILSRMLAVLDDGHVSLTAPDRDIVFSNKIRNELIDDSLFSIPVVKSYLEQGFIEDDESSYIYGKIKDEDLAYIYFEHVGENFFKLNDFLNEYSDVNGYVIDLRHNEGGDFTYCFSEIGRLINQSYYVFSSKTKNGPERNDYTEWNDWYIHPKGAYVNKRIVVLADRYTISAGERAVMAFKTLPNVTVVGDTTNGAHGTMIGRELANGWFYSIVIQKVKLYDGISYEGIGIAPDVYSKNVITEITDGIDKTLQLSIEILNE